MRVLVWKAEKLVGISAQLKCKRKHHFQRPPLSVRQVNKSCQSFQLIAKRLNNEARNHFVSDVFKSVTFTYCNCLYSRFPTYFGTA